MGTIEQRLSGGHHNSLGDTVAVVEDILAGKAEFDELFECYFSEDVLVRLRVSNAVKRLAKADRSIVLPYIDRLQSEVSEIDQDSAQWTLAQLFLLLEDDLSARQKDRAIEILKHNIKERNDWIVLNFTMETLFEWSKDDDGLREFLLPYLKKRSKDTRNSVAKRASKYLSALTQE